MGFKEARRWLIAALLDGRYQHESRHDQEQKNLLSVGHVTVDVVVKLLKECNGTQHSRSTHHQDSSIEIHVFKPVSDGDEWYIKVYQLEPDAVFISVHLSEHGD